MRTLEGNAPTRRNAVVLSERVHTGLLVLTLSSLLLGFVVLVLREVLATLGAAATGRADEYQLFAVSLTGLAGGVFAAGMRRDGGAGRQSGPGHRVRQVIGTALAIAYVVSGAVALIVCLVRLGESTVLLRSLAATFLGSAVAAASAAFAISAPEGGGS